MLLFPQLLSGATAQFPLEKWYNYFPISNAQEDGSRYQADGQSGVEIGWTLTFGCLTSSESILLSAFFGSTFGRLLSFVFLDPEGNLIAWSEDLSQPVWAKSPLFTVSASIDAGFTTQFIGSDSSAVSVSQIVQCPAAALLCFSFFAKTEQSASVTLTIADISQTFEIGRFWKQYSITRSGSGDSDTVSIGLSLNGQAFFSRLTVSSQPAPANYTVTRERSGAFPNVRFDQDSLVVTALDNECFSCEVRLISRLR